MKLDPTIERMRLTIEKRTKDFKAFLETQPTEITCERHPDVARKIDFDASWSRSYEALTAVYTPCEECTKAKALLRQNDELIRAGVTPNLLHATLDNFLPDCEAERVNLEAVRKFVATARGFLLMLGAVGTGKSHLAVAAMRFFKRPLLIKQSTLLRQLRLMYRDREADDPIELCQQVDLLCLDEAGLSAGGRDELPMLHEILDYRHGYLMPTIITSNLSLDELKEVLGGRLSDRLRESAFEVLNFGGRSRRPGARTHYFDITKRPTLGSKRKAMWEMTDDEIMREVLS